MSIESPEPGAGSTRATEVSLSSLGVTAFASPSSLAGEALLMLLRVFFTEGVTGAESSPSLATDLSVEVSLSSLLLPPLLERVRVREERVEGTASLSESLLSLDSTATSLLSELLDDEEDDDDEDLVARGDTALFSLLAEDEPDSESETDALVVLDSLLLLLLSAASGFNEWKVMMMVIWVTVKLWNYKMKTTIMVSVTRNQT